MNEKQKALQEKLDWMTDVKPDEYEMYIEIDELLQEYYSLYGGDEFYFSIVQRLEDYSKEPEPPEF